MKPAFAFLTFLLFFSCKSDPGKEKVNPEKFDRTKWLLKDEDGYPHRNAMLQDIIGSDTIKKFKRSGVENLLGAPTRTDTNYLFYRILEEKLGGVWTTHTKTLVVKFKPDSSVEWVKIHQ